MARVLDERHVPALVERLLHDAAPTVRGAAAATLGEAKQPGVRSQAVKALMQAEAFATLLYPEGGIVADGAEMVREMAVQQITADKVVEVVKDQVMMTAREALNRLPSLSEATLGWLDQYQKGRFEVYVDTSGIDKSVEKLASFGRQVVIAMILVGMLIGSAIATTILRA